MEKMEKHKNHTLISSRGAENRFLHAELKILRKNAGSALRVPICLGCRGQNYLFQNRPILWVLPCLFMIG